MTRRRLEPLRSLLYVPAHRRRFVEGAHARGADAIILDLEDGVPDAAKEEARDNLAWAVPRAAAGGARVVVRVNRPWRLAWRDLEAAVAAGAAAVMLPKVESPDRIAVVSDFLTELEGAARLAPLWILALVETARGLQEVDRIAAAGPRLAALVPGNEDLALSLGIATDAPGMAGALWPLVLAAKASGLAPLGTIGGSAGYRDLDAYRQRVQASFDVGFAGTTCIHPDQVAVANEVYRPAPEAVARARAIVAAFEAAGGEAVGLDGQMIDRPVYLRARRLVDEDPVGEE